MTLHRFLAIAVGSLVLSLPSAAGAHGKEIRLDVGCSAADSQAPLVRQCRATVSFAGDGEPVARARIGLRALRPGRAGIPIEADLPATDAEGRTAGTVELPAYGTWELRATVADPATGDVRWTDEVLPPSGAVPAAGGTQVRLLAGWSGRDVANVAMLLVHVVGTFALLGANALVLVASKAGGLTQRRRAARLFPGAAGASLVLLAASGAYSAVYNTPTRPPGLFRPGTIGSIPFGAPYLLAFGVKMTLAAALFAGTAWLAVRLRVSRVPDVPAMAGGSEVASILLGEPARSSKRAITGSCAGLAFANVVVGVLVVFTVVVVDYMHLLIHAGAFLGS